MIGFKQFITEETSLKTNSPEHIEDKILHPSVEGLHSAVNLLRQVHEHVQTGTSESKILPQYNGGASVVFGHHPSNGKFFVGTKSVFNKNPKINYSEEDIENNHGNSPELSSTLKDALTNLKKVTPKSGVFQGNLMQGDKSKFGIAVNTQYHGSHLNNMNPHFEPELHTFKQHNDVHMFRHEIDASKINHSAENESAYKFHMEKAIDAAVKAPHNTFPVTYTHNDALKTFINKNAASGVSSDTEGFKEHLSSKHKKVIDSAKSDTAKKKRSTELQEHLNHIDNNKKQYDSLFDIHNNLLQAKNALISSLDSGKDDNAEGYTLLHHGTTSKLVNRAEFSKNSSLNSGKYS
jgi:Family of unknown function (DUF6267)